MTGRVACQSVSGKEWRLQSTNVRQIKAALVEQAFFGTMRVSCPLGSIVAESRVERPTASDDPWLEAQVPGGEC